MILAAPTQYGLFSIIANRGVYHKRRPERIVDGHVEAHHQFGAAGSCWGAAAGQFLCARHAEAFAIGDPAASVDLGLDARPKAR